MNISKIFYLSFFLFVFPVLAHAQTSIAVLDTQMLLSQSKAGKHIQGQVTKQRDGFIKKLSEKESALKKKEKVLVEEASSLSKEDFLEKRKVFEKEFQDMRSFAQKEKARLDKALIGAMSKLRTEMFDVVQEIATEKNYDLVLGRQSVILGGNSLDISKEALKRLDKAVSKIELSFDN